VTGVVVRAAGGVLWRESSAAGCEIALIHRPRYDDWSLPKGKLDPGEHPLVAACREVVEETGITPVAGPRLQTVSYLAPAASGQVPKTVDYWAMRAVDAPSTFTPNDEVDAVRWLPLAEAEQLLSYDHDRPVVAEFSALHPVTGIVLLIRHGRAGSRKEWNGDDRLRPLDGKGQAQAVRIGQALPWFAPRRVLSADPLRCVQTVEPLAAAIGVEIETDPVFNEEQHAREPKRAAARIRELAAGGGAVAVCSQSEVIPDTVTLLAGADGLPLGEVNSRKGSVWVLSFRRSTLVAADYLPRLEP
jgi:8-oxo-dGTP diphosphatase